MATIVTTTTSPRAASAAPRYIGMDPAPTMKAPPWSQTSTGRRRVSAAGVQTFSVRQSSLGAEPTLCPGLAALAACIAGGPKVVASRTPSHGAGGWGGAKRSRPTGGRA